MAPTLNVLNARLKCFLANEAFYSNYEFLVGNWEPPFNQKTEFAYGESKHGRGVIENKSVCMSVG